MDALERKRETFQRKVDLIERLKAEQSGPVHMLDEVSKSLPDFVWLSGLDQTGAAIRFNGQSSGLTSVADFISALQRTGWFPQVDLVSSTEANNLVTYALQAQFKNPEVAAKEAAAAAAAAARAQAPPRGTRTKEELGERRSMADNALTRMSLAGQLGVSLFLALVIGGAVLVAVPVARHGRGEDEDGAAGDPAARDRAPWR